MNNLDDRELRQKKLMAELKRRDKLDILEIFNLPAKPSTDGYFHYIVSKKLSGNQKKSFKAKTLEQLQEKIYGWYMAENAPETFQTCFEKLETAKTQYIIDETALFKRQRSISRDRSEYKRFFANTNFEQMAIDAITESDICDICLFNFRRYSDSIYAKTFQSMRNILSSTIQYAYSERLVDENVYARACPKLDRMKVNCVKSAPLEQRQYSEAEIVLQTQYLHEKQQKQPGYFVPFALELQMILGLRLGEIPPLQWSDYYEMNGARFLNIDNSLLSNNMISDFTKTGKRRTIPLFPEAVNVLERVRWNQQNIGIESKYIFCDRRDPERPVSYDSIGCFHTRMLKKLGIKTSRKCIKGGHSFRRTKATEMRNNGFSPQVVSNFLGHSIAVDEAHYYAGGFSPETVKAIAAT